MSEPIEEQLVPCSGCSKRPAPESGRPCCCNFYVLPIAAAQDAVRELLAQVVGGVATMRHTLGEELEVRVNAKVATDPDARTALAEFVDGKTW